MRHLPQSANLFFSPLNRFNRTAVNCLLAITVTALLGMSHMCLAVILHLEYIRAQCSACFTPLAEIPINNWYFHMPLLLS